MVDGVNSVSACENVILFFQNEVIFVQLDALDKLDRIAHGRKHSSVMVRVANS